MNTPSNNPYPDSSPPQNNNLDTSKGSVFAGFFIGWALMIGGSLFTGTLFGLLSSIIRYDSTFMPLISTGTFSLPIIIMIIAMVWFGKSGKSKTVKGIAASIISLIALVLLLVAACFGIFAMDGRGFH
ncbi:MAG: hypothetical protein ABIP02_04115 [Arenimonas sp.]